MNRRPFFTFLLACGLALPLSSQAAFKCWTNSEGVRECGNAIPPEYAQQKSETVNERGLTVEVQERAKTQEELDEERRIAEEEERRKTEEAARRKEQDAYDRVLLSTFLSEKEIIDSRDRKTGAIDASIEISRITIDKLEGDLKRERKRAANFERKGRQIPENVQKSIDALERQIADKQSYIESKKEEKQEIMDKYAKDLDRFLELKEQGRRLR
jgi:hypothetical protein